MKAKFGSRPDDLDRQRATEAGQAGAERESRGECAVDIDAEAARHALVVDGRAHLRAEARVFQASNQQHCHRQCDPNQEQTIFAQIKAEQIDRPAQQLRRFNRLVCRAEDVGGDRNRR